LVLNVPQQSVQRDQAGAFVMVVGGDDMVEQRRVVVARTDLGRSVITEGLDEGEQVITEGINKVRPGIAVDAAIAGTTAPQTASGG
ncbi:MAG: HlyD family secretion protein, partial [Pseudomonadota bacterium]